MTPDLADPELYASGAPEAVWAELRARSPVHWNERADGTGFWALTRYHDIVRVYQDYEGFTSERGMALDSTPAAVRAAAGRMLIVTDPPRHHEIRRVMSSAFTPRMVRRLEDTMRETVVASLAGALEAAVDFTDVAARLPMSVVCDLLGVPREDREFMLRCTQTAFGVAAPVGEDPADAASRRMRAHADLLCYYDEYLGFRRRNPGADVVSALLAAVVDGAPLTDEEIVLNCNGLITGGNETTRHAATAGLLAFIRAPAAWERLGAEPSLLDGAVQEILRYTSPALHVMRTATSSTRIRGERIEAGDRVTLWNPSGNRDEEVFADGDVFDVARRPARLLTFGGGPHHCLGGSLAGQELRILFGELRSRVRCVRPAGPVRRLRSNLIWGIESLPVHLDPR